MRIGIQLKILIPVMLILFLTFGAVTFFSYKSEEQIIVAAMKSQVASKLDELVTKYRNSKAVEEILRASLNKNYIRITKALAQIIAEDPSVLSIEEMQRLADTFKVDEIHVTDEKGVLQWGTVPDLYGFDFATTLRTRPFLQALRNKNYAFAQTPQPRGADQVLFQYISAARQDKPGIVQIGLQPKELREILSLADVNNMLKSLHVDENGGHGYIADPQGNILFHPDQELIGKNLKDIGLASVIGRGKGDVNYTSEEEEWYLSFRYADSNIYLITINQEVHLAPLRSLLIELSVAALIAIVLTNLLIQVFVIRFVVKPLKMVKGKLYEIAEGEGDLTGNLDIKSKDEIGEVAHGFNSFVRKLHAIIVNVKGATSKTTEIRASLGATTRETAASLTQISANIEGVRNQMGTLDSNIINTVSTVDQIQSNINGLNRQIEEQTSAVEESSASIHQMVASLNNVAGITSSKRRATRQLVETTKTGGRILGQTIHEVQEIHNGLDTISEMVKIINAVAAQTNLLAMNAAIEAAHAGEAGKGFSVVADEIRKLAEGVRKNSKDIAGELKEIINRIKKAVQSSDETNKAFSNIQQEVEGVSLALDEIDSSTIELSNGGEQILKAMELLNKVSVQVKQGSDEMTVGARQMNDAMQTVKRISSEVIGAVNEISSGTTEIGNAMNQVENLTIELADTTETMEIEINRFKTT